MARSVKPVVLITGVSGGIGMAAAKLFLAQGWNVVGTVRGRGRANGLRGLRIDVQLADMVKPRDLERVVQTAWRKYGRLDALVCNAGYGLVGPIDTLSYVQMTEQFLVNTLAPAELVRQTVPLMRRQGGGVIIGISSIVGRTGIPGYSLYSASKFGLEGLFESLSTELAAADIQVRLIEPSGVNTGFWTALRHGKGGHGAEMTSSRYLTPEAVAAAVYRAATDRGSQLRYPLGQTRWLGYARRILPDRLTLRVLRKVVTGN